MISFVTPHLSGAKWLELHLSAIRKFHPNDEIIISATNNDDRKIVEKYGGRYFDNNTDYYQAVEFLFGEASNDIIVLSDCDTVLFSNVGYLAQKLDKFDFIGIEELIRHPIRDRWERYAPSYVDFTFFMFSREKFKSKIANWPKIPRFGFNNPNIVNTEGHYRLCEIFPKHYYLRPYNTKKYGLGNLIKDGEKQILYHQWYGSWEKRGAFMSETNIEENPYQSWAELKAAEEKFFNDYPNLDFSGVWPAFKI